MLEILSPNLILRDLHENDVADYLHWYTVEKEWMDWDAPWEGSDDIDLEALAQFYRKRATAPLTGLRHRFQIENNQGEHLGWVTSYRLADDHPAIGIDIPSQQQRNRGYGTLAYTLFLRYFLFSGSKDIFTQTWSGNTAMMALAKRVGFVEVHRNLGERQVRGESYDGITFKLDLALFYASQGKEPLWVLSDEWQKKAFWVRDLWNNENLAVLKQNLSWGLHHEARQQGIEERFFKIAREQKPKLTWEEFLKLESINIK
jgi:RimJ/RimL family protein N-acetyltransferase